MKESVVLLPKAQKITKWPWRDIKLARLRRKLSTSQAPEQAGISRAALWQIEKGKPSVAMGAYFQVLFIWGSEADFLQLGADDKLGRKLLDIGLLVRKWAPKIKKTKMELYRLNGCFPPITSFVRTLRLVIFAFAVHLADRSGDQNLFDPEN